jgi:hypothetical protein
MLRLKTMLNQVRTQCANDIRKRDVQIQRLKSHLTTQQRGTRPPLTNTTITVTAPFQGTAAGTSGDGSNVSVDDPSYSLTQETTEFLTRLSQNLSDENDNLIGLVRSTLTTLRSVQGLSATAQAQPHDDGAAETEGASDGTSDITDTHLVQVLPTSYETLASDMDEVLEHLRTLLSNPSFVPLEEVEMREEEIIRLREGWEKMEGRWREAVKMMDGWRKRMASGGKAVNLDELKLGLSLSPVKVGGILDVVEEGEEESGIAAAIMEAHDADESMEGDAASEEDEQSPMNDEHHNHSEALVAGPQPETQVLGDISGNRVASADPSAVTSRDIFQEIAADEVEDGSDDVALLQVTDRKPGKSWNTSNTVTSKTMESKIPRQVPSSRIHSPQSQLDSNYNTDPQTKPAV